MAAGSLIVQMAVDLARFRSDMGQAASISNTRLREIQRSAESAVRQISSVGRTISTTLGAIGVGVSVGAIVAGLRSAAAEAIRFGDEMQKAALRTGIGAGEFATLASAAKLADVEVATLSKALRAMQVAISQAGSGSKAQAAVFKALGVEFESFRALKPEQQLEVLADALTALRDPADRARAGTALFGRAWEELAPFMLQGAAAIREARREVEALGGVLTDEQIAQLADADQAMKKLSLSWRGLARELTVDVAGPIANTVNAIRLLGETLRKEGASATWFDYFERVKKFNQLQAEIDRRQLLGAGRQATRRLGPLAPPGFETEEKTTVDKRTAAERAGITAIAVTAHRLTISATEQLYRDMDRATRTAIENQLAEWTALEEQIRELSRGRQVRTPSGDVITESARISAEEAAKRLEEVQQQFLEPIKVTAKKIFPEKERSELQVFAEEAARNMQDAFAEFLFDPFKDGVNGMLAGFIDVGRRMIAEIAAQQLLRGFFSWGAGLGGGIGSLFSSLGKGLTGVRAMGGPVMAGGTYLVGERGPELLMAGTSGTVIPGGLGGTSFSYHIDARGADAERIMAVLPPLLKQTQEETIARVRDLQKRGRL